MSETALYGLRKRLGLYSRFAGLGFVVLSVVFLILSVYDQFIVFEVDSVAAFVAAMVLLFRDPHSRVESSVLDAAQLSSDQAIQELSARLKKAFRYVPTGDGVAGVELVASSSRRNASRDSLPNSDSPGVASPAGSAVLTPPGRGLAVLFAREEGLKKVTMGALRVSLTDALRDDFGLARSAEIVEEGERVEVVLHHPASGCACKVPEDGGPGRIGCTVASFLAVLVSAATDSPLSLEGCKNDRDSETWTVTMHLDKTASVSA